VILVVMAAVDRIFPGLTVLQVHDESVLETPEGKADRIADGAGC